MTGPLQVLELAAAPYTRWIKLAGALILAGSLAGGGFWLARTIDARTIADMKADHALALAESEQDGRMRQQLADEANTALALAAQHARDELAHATFKLIFEVPHYVTPETDARYPLPCGLIRLHDAALAGTEPDAISLPPGLHDADPCPVKASDAADAFAWNYSKLREALSDLDTWDAWYAQQSAIWNKEKP